MTAIPVFNTFTYIKKLREVGVPEKQAEIQAEALTEIIEDKIATKQDIASVRQELKQDITLVKQELKQDIASVKQDMKQLETNLRFEIDLKCAELKSEIIKWVLAITSTQTGLIIAFIGMIKFLH